MGTNDRHTSLQFTVETRALVASYAEATRFFLLHRAYRTEKEPIVCTHCVTSGQGSACDLAASIANTTLRTSLLIV
jgi:hypothetical protein